MPNRLRSNQHNITKPLATVARDGFTAMVDVNHQILVWARETSGLTVREAAKKLGIGDTKAADAESRLARLESGEDSPSRSLLEKMAQQYHRPILSFYMNTPPERGDRGEDFRTLPRGTTDRDRGLVDAVVRKIHVRQSLVMDALENEEEAVELPFIGSESIDSGAENVAAAITDCIKFDMGEYRQLRETAIFQYLRSLAENVGIFVVLVKDLGSHQTNLSVDLFRGFALASKVAPFIAVNSNDSEYAKAFTLIHELAHLWIGRTGIGDHRSEDGVERFCNDVSVSFLLPEGTDKLAMPQNAAPASVIGHIRDFARQRNVSISMVALAMLRNGKISKDQFSGVYSIVNQRFTEERQKRKEDAKQREGGPSYHTVHRHRAGRALTNLVGRMLDAQAITATKAGKILGVSGKNVQGVLDANKTGKATA